MRSILIAIALSIAIGGCFQSPQYVSYKQPDYSVGSAGHKRAIQAARINRASEEPKKQVSRQKAEEDRKRQDANFLGYDCVLLEDCTATTSPEYCMEATLYNVKQIFGFVANSNTVLSGLETSS